MTATLSSPPGQMVRGSVTFPSTGDQRPTLDFAAQLNSISRGLQEATQRLRQARELADRSWDGVASEASLAHLDGRLASLDSAAFAIATSVDPVYELSRAIGSTAACYSRAAETEVRLRQTNDPQHEDAIRRAIAEEQHAVRALLDSGELAAARLRSNTQQLVAARTAMTPLPGARGADTPETAPPSLTFWDHVVQGVLGDVANFWGGQRDNSLPFGQLAADLMKTWKIATWVRLGQVIDVFPTFNNGMIGKALADFLWRFESTQIAGLWLSTPKLATPWFRGLGVVGGAVSTGIGVADLIKQGNPVDAFNANPAGYIADVAGTAFSASTTAFMIAPNPVTAGAAIVTGVVWAGAEVVDHWDDISEWTGDSVEAAGELWDDGVEAIAETGAAINRSMNDAWDSAVSFFTRSSGPSLGAWF